jgi:Protein involved in formate dehydrogenase formation
LADCDFNRAALHPAYPIKCRTSTQRTQAPESVDTPKSLSPLDPCQSRDVCPVVTVEASGARYDVDPFGDDLATLGLDLIVAEAGGARHGPNPLLLVASEVRASGLPIMRPVRGKAWTTRVVFDSLARALESGRAWRGVGSVKKLLHLEVLTLVVAAHWMICTT